MKRYKVGYIAGMFDILHIGHIDILRSAKEQCEHLIVAVGTDDFLKVRKDRNPIIPYEERAEIVSAIKYVDEVVPEPDLDKIKAYYEYHFDVMFAGNDHEFEPAYMKAAKVLLESYGVNTIYLPHTYPVSSTLIRSKILKNPD